MKDHRSATRPAARRAGWKASTPAQHVPTGDGGFTERHNRLCCMELHHECASKRRAGHKRQSGCFMEKSSLFGTKRLILAIRQCSLWRLICALCPDFGSPGDLRAFTENMMNEGRRLWMRDG